MATNVCQHLKTGFQAAAEPRRCYNKHCPKTQCVFYPRPTQETEKAQIYLECKQSPSNLCLAQLPGTSQCSWLARALGCSLRTKNSWVSEILVQKKKLQYHFHFQGLEIHLCAKWKIQKSQQSIKVSQKMSCPIHTSCIILPSCVQNHLDSFCAH